MIEKSQQEFLKKKILVGILEGILAKVSVGIPSVIPDRILGNISGEIHKRILYMNPWRIHRKNLQEILEAIPAEISIEIAPDISEELPKALHL